MGWTSTHGKRKVKNRKKPSAGFKCYFVDLDIGQSFFQKKHYSLLALPKKSSKWSENVLFYRDRYVCFIFVFQNHRNNHWFHSAVKSYNIDIDSIHSVNLSHRPLNHRPLSHRRLSQKALEPQALEPQSLWATKPLIHRPFSHRPLSHRPLSHRPLSHKALVPQSPWARGPWATVAQGPVAQRPLAQGLVAQRPVAQGQVAQRLVAQVHWVSDMLGQ